MPDTLRCRACNGDGSLRQSDGFFSGNICRVLSECSFLTHFLDDAIEATGAQTGNIQLFDPACRGLRIAAHRGFKEDFLSYFAIVRADGSACAAAMNTASRIIVPDVSSDPIFKGRKSGEVMLRAQSLAVQSTPLFTSRGQFLGVISTHFRRPKTPSRTGLRQLDAVTRDLVAKIEEQLLHPKQSVQ